MDNTYLTTPQFAKKVGRSVLTIKKWEEKGFLKPARRDEITGYRYYTKEQVAEVLEKVGPSVIGNRANNGKVKGPVLDVKTGTMIDVSEMLSIGEFAEAVGRSVVTIKLWDKEGKVAPTVVSSKGNRRFYTKEQVEEVVATTGRQSVASYNCTEEVVESNLLSIGEFAKLIGKTPLTLKNWEKSGKLIPTHVDEKTRYRYYTREQAEEVMI